MVACLALPPLPTIWPGAITAHAVIANVGVARASTTRSFVPVTEMPVICKPTYIGRCNSNCSSVCAGHRDDPCLVTFCASLQVTADAVYLGNVPN